MSAYTTAVLSAPTTSAKSRSLKPATTLTPAKFASTSSSPGIGSGGGSLGSAAASSLTMVADDHRHPLSNGWVLWAHLPHDSKWNMESYVRIAAMHTVEEAIALMESLPANLVENCMLFLMREGIAPRYEDPENIMGGYFSYKVANKAVPDTWRKMAYAVMGNVVSRHHSFVQSLTGITISPKKGFCILKVWMRNGNHQDATMVTTEIKTIQPQGCIFGFHPKNNN